MFKKNKSILVAILCGVQTFALACEYNVRDVGFVDLKTQPYRLFIFVDDTTSDETKAALDDSLFMGLLDSNIEASVVDIDSEKVVPGKHLLKGTPIETFPTAILESPKGYTHVIPFDDVAELGVEAIEEKLGSIMHSPMRTTLLEQVTNYYGVVLVIEGPDDAVNAAIHDAATRSVRKIHTRMKMLPKAIANPPVVQTITQDQIHDEKLLVWSLGAYPNAKNEAHVVILYGRGRQMGPVLKGDAITEERLTSYLQVIGADCECGLDRSWMQGTMIPLQWSDEIQEMVSTSLGFDPENPRTKMEISMTVAKGQKSRLNSGSETKNPDAAPLASAVSFAYNEDVVAFDTPDPSILDNDDTQIAALSPSLLDGTATRETIDGDVLEAVTNEADNGGLPVGKILIGFAALGIIGTSAGIVIRGARQE
jgi:hypothetical protein